MFFPILFHFGPLYQMDTAQFLDFQIQKPHWDNLACFQHPCNQKFPLEKYRITGRSGCGAQRENARVIES